MISRRAFLAGALALPVVAALPEALTVERMGRFAVTFPPAVVTPNAERWSVLLRDTVTGERYGTAVLITDTVDERNMAAARNLARRLLRESAQEMAAA